MNKDLNARRQLLGQEVADALSASFFARFRPGVVERLLADALPVELPPGSTLYRDEGQPRCALVTSGFVRVYLSSPEGRQITVRYARPGDVLGIAVTVGGPVAVSVQVLTDTRLLMLNVATLEELGRNEPGVGWLMAEELTHRLYDTLEALAGNVFGSVRQRVARHLLDLATPDRRDGILIARITQQELADAVGSVRPVVARALGGLRSDGIITSTSDGIAIPDPARLHAETWRREL